jgi:hypothetical protein
MRRAVQTLLAAVTLLAMSSCMSVPDSGPVLAGPAVGSDDEPVLRYVPDGPRPGAEPVEIINGYLDAMRAYPANPGIVRQFLTDRAGNAWSPGTGTRIYTTRPDLEPLGRDAVRVDTGLVAELDERGSWSRPDAGESRLRQVFELRRQRGEWRITNPADGLLVPEYDFERYYRAFSLYFFDAARRVLVPDPVYLPQGDQTASLLVRGLVRGPTDWLRGAVTSVVPATPPGDLAVPVSEQGVAQVQLGSTARGLGAAERELLAAQLAWTLRQVPDVEAVRVSVDGSPLLLGGDSTVTAVDVGDDYDPADSAASQGLFALRDDRIVTVDPIQGLSDWLPGRFGSGRVPVSAFAVERTAQTVAAVTDNGTTVEVASIGAAQSQEWFGRGRSILGVQWDIHGLLWAVDRTASGPALRVLRDGRVAQVPLLDGAPADIRAFALSRDGLRLAVVDGQGADSRLMMGRVRRAPNGGLDVAVDRWQEVGGRAGALRDFVDVAWGSPTELTVVAEATTGSPQIFAVSIDGSSVEPAALVELDLVSVADAPDTDVPAVVATRPGTLFVELSDRWSELALQGALRRPAYVE